MALYPLWWVGGEEEKKPHFSVEVNKTYSLRALVKPRHTWGKKMKRCPDSRPLFLLGNQSIKLQGRERERKIIARRQWWKPRAAGKGTRNPC